MNRATNRQKKKQKTDELMKKAQMMAGKNVQKRQRKLKNRTNIQAYQKKEKCKLSYE